MIFATLKDRPGLLKPGLVSYLSHKFRRFVVDQPNHKKAVKMGNDVINQEPGNAAVEKLGKFVDPMITATPKTPKPLYC